jgi:hypothetical protein
MYNKPITQRVAFARSKKPSALKQTDTTDTTILNKDIMATLEKEETIPGTEGTPPKIEKKRKQSSIDFEKKCYNPDGSRKKGVPGCEWADEQGKESPEEYEDVVVDEGSEGTPDQKIKEEVPLYGFDRGDVDYTWQQRSRGRQALEGSRKAGKIARKGYEGMSDADRASSLGLTAEEYKEKGIKNKRQFGKAKKAYESAQASKSYDAYLQSQREASEQGISQGAKNRAKVTVPNRNKYVNELSKADIETESTASQRQDFYQNQKNENDKNTANAAKETEDNKSGVEKRNAQKDTANKDVKTVAEMKAGPLKMKSSFKMGGFGSKTYKK